MKFGTLAAAAALTMLSSNAFAEDAKAKKKEGKAKAPAAGKCVHDCAGYATCKGNGSNNCAGKNGCANEGIVPKECSSQTTKEACDQVKDKKTPPNKMCTWRDA
jgi:hypothetical protein